MNDMQNHVLPYLQSGRKRCEGETRTAGGREAVPRAGVEANTAVKDEGKAERKAVTQKKAMPGKETVDS